VGVEAFLLRADDGSVVHVPLTYRGAPMAGAEGYLVGTTEHSVLGRRWVYDGCADPVFATALATTVLRGGTQVQEFTDVDGRLEPRRPTATVAGSGTPGTHVTEMETVTAWSAASHDYGGAATAQLCAAGSPVGPIAFQRFRTPWPWSWAGPVSPLNR
jgi:hypothetical protein